MRTIIELIKNLKSTWRYTKGQRKYVFFVTMISVWYIATGVVVPILSAKVIVELTNNQLEQLLYIAGVLFLIECFRSLMHYVRRRCTQVIYRESFVKIQSEGYLFWNNSLHLQ